MNAADAHGSGKIDVFDAAANVAEGLAQYIESSYHIKNDALIAERRDLLRSPGILSQTPYIESSPSFVATRSLAQLDIQDPIKTTLLSYCSRPGGFFDPPFEHQAQALEAFFRDDRDLIISTGTGSGKTEAFFMPIIAAIEREIADRPESACVPAMRAILLYPMNALVNDQVVRLRRLLGDTASRERVKHARGRPIRFASYTGRTPYPGPRTSSKDGRYVAPLFDEFFLKALNDPQIRALLESVGRWPAKDLERFYAADRAELGAYRTGKSAGKPRTNHNWPRRLNTQSLDAELLTRHEALAQSPDILITNYSMLEYMLLRPLERSLFDETARWLALDDRNQLILVIDEAHLYRGAAGAEVGLLIRRLMSRLFVARDRIRVILTSASIAGGPDGENIAKTFATDLTGTPETRQFSLIRATTDDLGSGRRLSAREIEALATFPLATFVAGQDSIESRSSLAALARDIGWREIESGESSARYLFTMLNGQPYASRLLETLSKGPVEPAVLIDALCKDGRADGRGPTSVNTLLSLCAAAERPDSRRLLSARLHLFVRGLPALWACTDSQCSERRAQGESSILGRLYVSPVEQCICSSGARVYELLTHRDCGAAFIQGFVTSLTGGFAWTEAGSLPDSFHPPRRLYPVEMLIDGDPHPDYPAKNVAAASLDIKTGRLMLGHVPGRFQRRVWLPEEANDNGEFRFRRCPVCLGTWKSQLSAIERHATFGEGPFAVITRSQLKSQPDVPLRRDQVTAAGRYPNRGRKVLVFSDGRQRAAKLARVMPEVAEQDAFRQAIITSAVRLIESGRQPLLSNRLYTAFVSVAADSGAAFFSGSSARELFQHAVDFRRMGSDLLVALEEPFDNRPHAYDRALLAALCGRFYSLEALSIGYVAPSDAALRQIMVALQSEGLALSADLASPLTVAWIGEALRDYAFDERLAPSDRRAVAHYYRDDWRFDSKFAKSLSDAVRRGGSNAFDLDKDLDRIALIYQTVLTAEASPDQRFLTARQLKLVPAFDANWFHCSSCQALRPVHLGGHCIVCYRDSLELMMPTHPYIIARKDFWRLPIRAAVAGTERIETMVAAEHTAQLSHRDRASVYSTTEKHELRFQDILLNEEDRPIDVLSSTTTMEVGIDIGSLVAVGLRNIPPERSNYQQRAGRAGRRGASVSTVVSYADRGPHDSYYFNEPLRIISGPPRTPEIKVDNTKLARRHINAFVLQRFFSKCVEQGTASLDKAATLEAALGPTYDFFRDPDYGANLERFSNWLASECASGTLTKDIARWLPPLTLDCTVDEWVLGACQGLVMKLRELAVTVPKRTTTQIGDTEEDGEEDERPGRESYRRQLLEFCSLHGILPTYALPVDLASFVVDEASFPSDYWRGVRIVEQPQQDIGKALSEYAPGRIVTINGVDYRSGGIAASTPTYVKDRAARLFENGTEVWFCMICDAVRIDHIAGSGVHLCVTCGGALQSKLVLQPEAFYPEQREGVADDDRGQERTYATAAQLPVPANEDQLPPFSPLGAHLNVTHAIDQELVTVNKGRHETNANTGFWVCRWCGLSRLDAPRDGIHRRPYVVEGPRDKDVSLCKGRFENVFLGRRFRTDLLVLRFDLAAPMLASVHSAANAALLRCAFTTISQAVVSAASRHRELDVDPQEFGAGFRFTPSVNGLRADVYLYDVLAGGAGYADLAGEHIRDILLEALRLLEDCPADCARSCPQCLRHFRNQHLVESLDRKLGAQLLRYALSGAIPAVIDRARLLGPLVRWLEMDGCTVDLQDLVTVGCGGQSVLIELQSALLESIQRASQRALRVLVLTDYVLERDLPHCHVQVRQLLGLQRP